jgi:hypothetical protein
MQQHDSSVVRGVGYDWDEQVLTLNLNGRRYEYYGVPEEVYQHVLQSKSLGKAFNKHVKGFYDYQEIER